MLLSLLCLSPAALVAPTKLVVLQHGLYGAAVNMAVLQQELERLGGGEVLVHDLRDHGFRSCSSGRVTSILYTVSWCQSRSTRGARSRVAEIKRKSPPALPGRDAVPTQSRRIV